MRRPQRLARPFDRVGALSISWPVRRYRQYSIFQASAHKNILRRVELAPYCTWRLPARRAASWTQNLNAAVAQTMKVHDPKSGPRLSDNAFIRQLVPEALIVNPDLVVWLVVAYQDYLPHLGAPTSSIYRNIVSARAISKLPFAAPPLLLFLPIPRSSHGRS